MHELKGGYVYTLTPAFGGPGCLSKTISFLCSASESQRCDVNVKDWGHLHVFAACTERK